MEHCGSLSHRAGLDNWLVAAANSTTSISFIQHDDFGSEVACCSGLQTEDATIIRQALPLQLGTTERTLSSGATRTIRLWTWRLRS